MGEAAPCRGYFPQAPIFPGWERYRWGISASADADQRLCLWTPQAFEKA